MLQFGIMATDNHGNNSQSTDAMVTVHVSRDQQPPMFTSAPYSAVVSENLQPNATVTQIIATDPDLQVGPFHSNSNSSQIQIPNLFIFRH